MNYLDFELPIKELEDQLNASIKDRDEFILVSKEYS